MSLAAIFQPACLNARQEGDPFIFATPQIRDDYMHVRREYTGNEAFCQRLDIKHTKNSHYQLYRMRDHELFAAVVEQSVATARVDTQAGFNEACRNGYLYLAQACHDRERPIPTLKELKHALKGVWVYGEQLQDVLRPITVPSELRRADQPAAAPAVA